MCQKIYRDVRMWLWLLFPVSTSEGKHNLVAETLSRDVGWKFAKFSLTSENFRFESLLGVDKLQVLQRIVCLSSLKVIILESKWNT
jgi:hypothetical protein